MGLDLTTYKLDKPFDVNLSYAPYGLMIEDYTGEVGACYISRGREGKPVLNVLPGRVLDYGEPLVDLWIHNTKAQTGCELAILTATENAVRSLVRPEQVNPKSMKQGTITVGTTAVALPSHPVPIGLEVVVIADKRNTEPVYVGSGDVTVETGIRLDPGEYSTMRVANSSCVYAVSSKSGQRILYNIGMTSKIAGIGLNPTDVVQGEVSVSTSATALPDNNVPPGLIVVVTAKQSNTDPVYVGGSDVTTANGVQLDPGNSMAYSIRNTSGIYVISSATGQSVTYVIALQPPQIVQKLNPTDVVQGRIAVGTSATQFPAQAVPPGISVVITADPGNSDAIYVGGSGVTVNTGQELLAACSMQLWVNNLNSIYAVAAVTGQYVRYIVEVMA